MSGRDKHRFFDSSSASHLAAAASHTDHRVETEHNRTHTERTHKNAGCGLWISFKILSKKQLNSTQRPSEDVNDRV